jgi:hypothetical protein
MLQRNCSPARASQERRLLKLGMDRLRIDNVTLLLGLLILTAIAAGILR